MKTLTLFLMLTTVAYAGPLEYRAFQGDALIESWHVDFTEPHGQYDNETGGLSLHNMGDRYMVSPRVPTRAGSDGFLAKPNSSWINREASYRILQPSLYTQIGGSSFPDHPEWNRPSISIQIQSVFGFPDPYDLGTRLLKPDMGHLFSYIDMVYTSDGVWPIHVMNAVPEPGTWLMAGLAITLVLLLRPLFRNVWREWIEVEGGEDIEVIRTKFDWEDARIEDNGTHITIIPSPSFDWDAWDAHDAEYDAYK